MTDTEANALLGSYTQQLTVNRRFHLFRFSLAAVTLFFVYDRFNALEELGQARNELEQRAGLNITSTSLTVQSFIARLEVREGEDWQRQATINLISTVEGLVKDLDGSGDPQSSMATMTMNAFYERSDPTRRYLVIKVPYIDQFRLTSAALIYLSIGAFLLMLHERMLLTRTITLGEAIGKVAPLLEELPVTAARIPLGFGILGTFDNILALACWIYLFTVAWLLALHGRTQDGMRHLFVALCLHVAAFCVFRISQVLQVERESRTAVQAANDQQALPASRATRPLRHRGRNPLLARSRARATAARPGCTAQRPASPSHT